MSAKEIIQPTQESIMILMTQADTAGRLAQDAGAFAAVVAAFESQDPDAFRWVLQRLELLPHCELICEWVRTKFCVFRCLEVCGPPPTVARLPDLEKFARAVVKLASNEKLLRRVVDAVASRDPENYRSALAELKITDICHPLCRWICSVIYRRVCEVICSPSPVPILDPAAEIQAAGKAVALLLAKKKAFNAIVVSSTAVNCEVLQTAISQAGIPLGSTGCEIICRLVCSWRCSLVCADVCREAPLFPTTGIYAVEEARSFALAARQLAGQPRAVSDLLNALQKRDVSAYREIITRFGLGAYCLQVCAWVCSGTCFGLCSCVCPSQGVAPWFTTVGYFDIYSDIDPTSGKTNKSLSITALGAGGGGPNYAFYGQLQLGGFCPINSPTYSGVAMKYRFLYAIGSGSPQPITGNLVSQVETGTRMISWPQNVLGVAGAASVQTFQTVMIASAPTPPEPIPPAPGAPWVGPSAHYITPDANGWILVDPAAIGNGFQTLLGFDTTQVVPGGQPLSGAIGTPGGAPAGNAVSSAASKNGTDLEIIFQATRVTTFPPGTTPDYTNSLAKIHINNWSEVNNLWFLEFGTNCCTGIGSSLSVQFTVDHEEMDSGSWSLEISSCSGSAPGNITPTASGSGVTLSPRGGFGTIVQNTSKWDDCSYTVTLTTRPGLTTGLVDRDGQPNTLTFCICAN